MIKIEKDKTKMAESASLVIKSPVVAFQPQNRIIGMKEVKEKQRAKKLVDLSVAQESNSSNLMPKYISTPKKKINSN